MKNFLVTGAGGFIGGHVVKALARQNPNETVFALYRKKSITKSSKNSFSNIQPIFADLTNQNINKHLPENVGTVIHFAANGQSFVSSLESDLQFFNNLHMTSNLLNYSISNNIKKFALASSVYVYSGLNSSPFDEDRISIPGESLGASKIASEAILKVKAVKNNFYGIAFRIFTVYGPGCRTSQFIPQAIKKLQSDEPNAQFGSSTIRRDFIYIDDVVDAIISILRSDRSLNPFQSFNIGSGIATPIGDIVNILGDLIGANKKINYSESRLGLADVDHCASLKNIRQFFNWEPKVDLKSGLRKTIQYFNNLKEVC